MKLKIGNIEIENNLILAPMAGVTDLPFRLLCKEQGCGLLYSEMVSAKAITYNNKNTFELLKVEEKEHPIALQLFGSEPEIMAEAAKRLEEGPFDFFDINMGCPVPKVVNNNEGSALMKNPKLAGEIVEAMVKAVKKPVTVKFRTGFTQETINAVPFAKIIEASGASAIAVHGRTRDQYYSGKADWDIIRQVKEAVQIPVIGNGDVNSGKSAKALLDETACDGIMIGRGVKGNPWLFSQIKYYFETGQEKEKPTIEEVREMIYRHGKLQLKVKGEYTGIREMRKHIAWYTTGYPHSAAFRNKVNSIENMDSLLELLEYFDV
ncbi:MAG: tRNA dihydrouridine synthase DusB [Clostridiales bacterium]|nr:tRNA dihydrouridine synthase DusB [Clostridiales bacterium]